MTVTPPHVREPAWRALLDDDGRSGRPFGVLDVGSRKLCCYIARRHAGGAFELLGAGHQAADGFSGGEVIDAAAAEAAVRSVVDEAERQADERLDRMTLVFAGGEPASGYLQVEVALDGGAARRRDVHMALRHAARNATADGFAIVHGVPLAHRLDGGPEVRDATGMIGKTLVVRAHLVGVRARPLTRLTDCLERCHLRTTTVLAAPYAAALACLERDEAERGVMVLDCGARTTSLAVFHKGRLHYVAAVPQGAEHLTDELQAKLHVTRATAERLKNLEASVVPRSCDAFDAVEISPIGAASPADTVEVPRGRFTEILRPLSQALLGAVAEQLRQAPETAQVAARRGLVLTGGGAQQEGLLELASEMLGTGARLGRPSVLDGWCEPPVAAASGGLALAAGHDGGLGYTVERSARGPLGRPFESLSQWLRESLGVA
jgi:cell division protein FtsA